ncbi:tRNA (guanosine(37)-N1)-methyltransferase TrmD [Mycetocola reblochoni]|uniref:tRNA (guanine-N(1)-)-methyltransferase n=2 Tax=Mycetocola reblochoni TaxID=331618 RepID=A0A1R4JBR3_9MICO|nr:tRNA (guanosine(37)-N1)-methyltransferase TrmD [Mycetocola reblochoni]RLP69992.1 tRNA (guanosine(37)-N1)-methyltransferase TrmD [Mycetocola reblochoni]SJN29476.1 tRNA (Guanine37-N1)-methyltransferase [Mycetocola reblochoni REB411]
MRVDIVTIFPAFFDVLDLSLMGRARSNGVLDVRIHDLRDHAHDRHRTVDDTPYGGGAGMVMKPEPWGEALDAILADADDPLVVFPSPAGQVFRQSTAHELSEEQHLVFCCGRYEGIDQRVIDDTAGRSRTMMLSIGDYVLNGGESATMVVLEAVARLIPGMVGNPESLLHESHEQDGLLEYPVYTKPSSWRGHDVPPVLLSGHHGRVGEWRHAQQLERTRLVRPELLRAEDPRPADGEIGREPS